MPRSWTGWMVIVASAVAMGFPVLSAGEDGAIDWEQARQFWAFRAPVQPEVPEVQRDSWPRGDIDRFILAKLEAAGLPPAPEADRRTLAKRVFFDLTGLPPNAEEIDAFVAEQEPAAYEKLVDRLLASPAFGERMASIWLNIARYAEDQAHQVGNDQKYFYPHAHRYREWVIAAFNRDLPYDQFIRYQLAADQLGDAGRSNLAALGYLGLGPQYYNRSRLDVMAEEWEDSVDVVTRGFLALTVACARCHEHKYDPLTTHDYHALAGVFASTAIEKREVVAADGTKQTLHIVKEGKVQDLPVFNRGNVDDKGEKVPRRFLQILTADQPQQFSGGSGRSELAEAIADPGNPLTARVAVNRLWQQAFGRGLVATPSNFGQLGARPTHPELLDFLALRLVEDGWSIKRVLREIVSSSTYRQSAKASEQTLAADGANALWGRADRRRLSAEMLRDALLEVSGELSHGDSGAESLEIADGDNRRRTVYGRVSRKELDGFLATFDYPDANVHAARRDVTVTPAQKLFLLNNPYVIARAEAIAKDAGECGVEIGVESIYRRVLLRHPREGERRAAEKFLAGGGDPDPARWARFAHTLLLSNEFLFRD